MSSISSNEGAGTGSAYRWRERVLIAGALALVTCRVISARHSVAAMVFATLILTAVFTCYVHGWPWGRRWAFRLALPLALVANASALGIGLLVTFLAESGLLVHNRLGTYIEWNRAFVCVPLAGLLNLLAFALPAARFRLRTAAWLANGALAAYAAWYWTRHESLERCGGAPPFGADLFAGLAALSLVALAWENVPPTPLGSRPRWRSVFVFGLTAAIVLALLPAMLTVLRRCRSEYAVTSLGGKITDRSARIAPLRIHELAPLRPYVTEIEAVYIPKKVLTPENCEAFAAALGNLADVYEVQAAQVPDGCGALLRRLPPDSLEFVMLSGPGVTDETLADLSRCSRLTQAAFADSRISDDGLRHLSGFRWLRTLVLRGAPLSGSGIHHLTSLTGLTSLDLSETSVGDEHVGELAKLSALTALDLRGTRVSLEGIEELQRALPRCQIDWEPSRVMTNPKSSIMR